MDAQALTRMLSIAPLEAERLIIATIIRAINWYHGRGASEQSRFGYDPKGTVAVLASSGGRLNCRGVGS
jgi:hypothetical protein